MTPTAENRITLTPAEVAELNQKYPDFIPCTAPELKGRYTGGIETCPHCGAVTPWQGFIVGETLCWFPCRQECTCPGAVAEREQRAAEEAKRKAAEEAKQKAEQIARLQKKSGMGEREIIKTFTHTEITPDNFTALTQGRAHAEALSSGAKLKKRSMYITGAIGTGKTHLAAAMANALIEHGRSVIFTTFSQMMLEIRATYDGRGNNAEKEKIVADKYKTARILFLDDLGKEKATEWSAAQLFALIDYRYQNSLPTVITSNYTLDDLAEKLTPAGGDRMTAEAIIDRLWEDCLQVTIGGKSWRRR